MCLLAVLKSIIVKQLQHIAIIRAFCVSRGLVRFYSAWGCRKIVGLWFARWRSVPKLFSKFTNRFKIEIFECCSSAVFHFFSPESTKRVKIRIFECYARLRLPNFYQFMKELENWDFQMLADKLHLEIFPNSLKR